MTLDDMAIQVKAHGINALSPLKLDGEPMATLKFLALLVDTRLYHPEPKYWMDKILNEEN